MEQDNNINYIYKIVLIGDTTVGKTSLFNKMSENFYELDPLTPTTIGVDFKLRYIEKYNYNNRNYNIKLQLWDTAGQKRFVPIVQNYLKSTNGIILMYDVTNRNSFEDLENWYKEILDQKYSLEDTVIIIIGNKIDLESKREVTKEEGEKLAQEWKINFYEISTKEINKNKINKIINDFTGQLVKKNENKFMEHVNSYLLNKHHEESKCNDKCCIIS